MDITGELQRAQQAEPIHILVADDDPVTRKLVHSWLSPNYHITLCDDGHMAIQYMLQHKTLVDLVLSDVSMPTTDGMKLLAQIRETPEIKHIPVILMSGVSNSPQDVDHSIALGCDDYLIKPLIKNVVKKKLDTMAENIIQKKMLRSERHIRTSFETKVKKNKEKIRSMAQQISKLSSLQEQAQSVIETPITNIISLVKKLESDPGVVNTPLASELQQLLKALASVDLYKPSFQKLLEAEDDSVANSQLVAAFMPRTSTGPRRRNHGLYRSVSASASAPIYSTSLNLANIKAHQWGMNIWVYSFYEMETIAASMFESFDLLNQFKISKPVLLRFIHTVREHYFVENPYHNFQHAFSVLQSVYSLLCQFEVSKYLTNLDILALLIAALCHDIEHPGVNNAYLIKTDSPLSIRYNDIAVLENHHASICFQILKNSESAILSNLSDVDYRAVRKTIIDAILATDMEQHFTLTSAFASVLPSFASQYASNNSITISPEIRTLIVQLVMKCGDISNIALPSKVARIWVDRVAEEFFAQGDSEKFKGKTPPPFMDRSISTPPRISSDFTKFVGRPLFEKLEQIVPDAIEILNFIDRNLEVLQCLQDGVDETKIGDDFELDYEIHSDHIKNKNVHSKPNFQNTLSNNIQRTELGLDRGVSSASDFDGVFELEPFVMEPSMGQKKHRHLSIPNQNKMIIGSWTRGADEFCLSIPSTPDC